jgi:hypothetical protein
MDDEDLPICISSRLFLKLSLMWPLKGEAQKWLYARLVVYIVASSLSFTSLILMHIIKSVEGKTSLVVLLSSNLTPPEGGIDISEDLAILAATLGLTSMMVLYAVKQQDLLGLLRDLCDFSKFGQPPRFKRHNEILDLCVKVVFSYAIFGAVVYNLIKIVEIPKCKRLRKIREVCGVFVPLWTPFDADHEAVLTLLAVWVFLVVIVLDKVTLMVSLQVLEISWNIKMRIDQLKSMISRCFRGDVATGRSRLNECIQYHIDIIRYSLLRHDLARKSLCCSYANRFNSCFTNGMFIHLATTGIICGCLENQIAKVLLLLRLSVLFDHFRSNISVPFYTFWDGSLRSLSRVWAAKS